MKSNLREKSPKTQAIPFDKAFFADIETAVKQAQIMIIYSAEKGIKVSEEVINKVIQAKFLLRKKNWTGPEEADFWMAYNQLSKAIYPITIESLQAIQPHEHKPGTKRTQAKRAVLRYSIIAVLSLATLLGVHIYWLVGHSSYTKLEEYLQKEMDLIVQIGHVQEQDKLKKKNTQVINNQPQGNADLDTLNLKLHRVREIQEANYQILNKWNQVWMVLLPSDFSINNLFSSPKMPSNELINYIKESQKIQEKIEEKQAKKPSKNNPDLALLQQEIEALKERKKAMELHLASDEIADYFFFSELSAKYVIEILQSYFLPLLYGLLGAAMFVLRDLNQEIKSHVYSSASEISYRLRLPIGALAGLSISYFITPRVSASANISTFALSFLTGYNVEILFSIMDKLIANFSKQKLPSLK